MLKLYYLPGACSLVPHTALEWIGVDFDAQAVDHTIIKSPEYLALNPNGQVPLLQEGSWTLTQNVAILDYLNDVYPQAKLYGSGDARAVARAREWLDRDGVDAMVDITNSAAALAVQKLVREKGGIAMYSGPATTRLTDEDCAENGFHWMFDTYSSASGAASWDCGAWGTSRPPASRTCGATASACPMNSATPWWLDSSWALPSSLSSSPFPRTP